MTLGLAIAAKIVATLALTAMNQQQLGDRPNDLLQQRLQVPPEQTEQIEVFCQQWQVIELAVFGSVLRDDFRAESDVDLLVIFAPEARISLLDLVNMQNQLSTMFSRSIDLIEKRSIENSYNWIRRQQILNTATVIYELRPSQFA
jgi:predicted nucleotidyltransferase